MRIKLLSGEVLQCWDWVGLRERKRDTEVLQHRHLANDLIFSITAGWRRVSYKSLMKTWEDELYFWSLLVTL